MRATHYTRSDIYSFFELSDAQQAEHADLQESMFVDSPLYPGESLPLCNFMRTDGGRIHGIYGTSYFDAYGITLSRCGSQAVVSHLTW